MALRLERGKEYLTGSSVVTSQPGIQLQDLSLFNKQTLSRASCVPGTVLGAWVTSVNRQALLSALCSHGTCILVRKVLLGWGLTKARWGSGSWGTGILSVFQDRFRGGEGTEYEDAQGQSQTHSNGDLSRSRGGETGRVLFCAQVTLVQTMSTCQPRNGRVE